MDAWMGGHMGGGGGGWAGEAAGGGVGWGVRWEALGARFDRAGKTLLLPFPAVRDHRQLAMFVHE